MLEEAPPGARSFRFIQGPVFCQLLMADEINRAARAPSRPCCRRCRSATSASPATDHDLPAPFHVVATQNPLEQEGTYPLPEAQLDRFLMQIDVGYPELEDERRMLLATTGTAEAAPEAVLTAAELVAAQHLVRRVPVGEAVVESILRLVREGRPETTVDEGCAARCRGAPAPAPPRR